MSKKYYVERKADNVWVVAAEDGSDSQEFNDQGRAVRHCSKMNETIKRSYEQTALIMGCANPQTVDQVSDLIDCLNLEGVAVELDSGVMTLSHRGLHGASQRVKNLFSTCKAVRHV